MLSPKRVLDLAVEQPSQNEAVLSYTEVGDGEGKVAKIDLRWMMTPISWGSEDARSEPILPDEESAVGRTRRIIILLDGLGARGVAGESVDFQMISYRGNLRTPENPLPDPPATFPDPDPETGERLSNVATLVIVDFPEEEPEPEPDRQPPAEDPAEDPADDPASREVLVTKERVKLWRPFPWFPTPWGLFSFYVGEKLGDVEVPE